MTSLSKILLRSVPYNCYETAHSWSPSCLDAALQVARIGFIESLKMYSLVYLALQLLSRKYSAKDFLNTLHSILASTCFLGTNVTGIIVFTCLYRKLLGRFHSFFALLTGFTSCIVAILFERKTRRGSVTLYVTNCGSEILFKMLVARGFITPLPHGEVFLFATSISIYCYIVRLQGFCKDPVSSIIKYILGDEEARGMEDANGMQGNLEAETFRHNPDNNGKDDKSSAACVDQFPSNDFLRWMKTKHWTCPHKLGCAHYAIKGFLKPFTMGCLTAFGFQCLSVARTLLIKPSKVFIGLNYKRCLKFGVFLGGFCSTFRFINCILRWMFDKDKAEFALPAAFVGGLFMRSFPSSQLALCLMWKTVEVLCNIGIKKGVIPKIPGFMIFLYALSGSLTVHAIAAEPHNMRFSYWNFLVRLSRNKLLGVNRQLLDVLGTNASKLNPNYWPDLDIRYVSKELVETVLF